MVSGHKKGDPYIAKVADKRLGPKISPCTIVPLVFVVSNLRLIYYTLSAV